MRRFNVAWWAYSFTLTLLALASVEYAKEMKGIDNTISSLLSLILSALSILIFLCLTLVTVLNFDKLLKQSDPYDADFSNGSTSGTGIAWTCVRSKKLQLLSCDFSFVRMGATNDADLILKRIDDLQLLPIFFCWTVFHFVEVIEGIWTY